MKNYYTVGRLSDLYDSTDIPNKDTDFIFVISRDWQGVPTTCRGIDVIVDGSMESFTMVLMNRKAYEN